MVSQVMTAGSSMSVGASSEGGSWLGRVIAFIESRRRYRRTMSELEQLSDRELADIGLARADIEGIARRCVSDRY